MNAAVKDIVARRREIQFTANVQTNGQSEGLTPQMKMRHRVPLIVLVCTTLLSSHPARAQFSQQGPKLVGTGAVRNAGQGSSVSLSADGNTAIVGGPGGKSWSAS